MTGNRHLGNFMNEFLHRDDVPFEMIEEVEKNLSSKIRFPGDSDDEAYLERIRKHHAKHRKIFEQGRCFSCFEKIPSFNLNQIQGVTLQNSEETWKNQDCQPSFSMMQEFMNPDTEVTGIICRKCLEQPDGWREKSFPENLDE